MTTDEVNISSEEKDSSVAKTTYVQRVAKRQAELAEKEREMNHKIDSELMKNPEKMPKAVWFILPNEFCERFCFYGVSPLLFKYFKEYLGMDKSEAIKNTAFFGTMAYFFPLLGGALSDSYFGKYRTIVWLSIVYCIGITFLSIQAIPGLIAADPPAWSAILGMVLIAIGTGGIKPCVSSHGGDQYLPSQTAALAKFFSNFYVSINLGALISGYLTPFLKDGVQCFGRHCYPLAFGVPAALMFIAIILFIIGERYYRIVPPTGEFVPLTVLKVVVTAIRRRFKSSELEKGRVKHWLDYSREEYGEFVDEVRSFLAVVIVLLPVSVYKALYNQKDSTWQQQLDMMNMKILPSFINKGLMPVEAFGNFNPILVVLMAPIFARFLYPAVERRGYRFGAIDRMVVGYFIGILSFVIFALVQISVDAQFDSSNGCSKCLSAWWQLPQYVVITISEVFMMISGLEFAYSHVSKSLKSTASAYYLLMNSIGNFLIYLFESMIQKGKNKDGKVESYISDLHKIYCWIGIASVSSLLFLYLKKSFDSKMVSIHAKSG